MPHAHFADGKMGQASKGWGSGLLGVILFSGSLPATRVAIGGFGPVFLTSARAVIAGLLGAALLLALRQKRPLISDLGPLLTVALGVVIGFPLLTALALQHIDTARSIIFVGLLPLSTAIFGVLRGGERPKPVFWIFSIVGGLSVAGFAVSRGGTGAIVGDLLMAAAVVGCGLGYAEGAVLSRRLGGWQVICWALMLALPFMAVVAVVSLPMTWSGIGAPAWLGLAYVSIFSMLVGFVFWYRGLALGGIGKVGQLQLLQPFFGLALVGLILREPIAPGMVAVTALIVLCVAGARRFA